MSRVLPILFNTDMIRAILDGRKTVTRRIMKLPKHIKPQEDGLYTLFADGTCYENQTMEEIEGYLKPPYHPGDILYVRETWSFMACIECDGKYARGHQPCYDFQAVEYDDGDSILDGCFLYKADCKTPERISWRPSIHMPKRAARIWLKVTDVRVEKLQEIDGVNVLAEGIDNGKSNPAMEKRWENMQRESFKTLWNSTIKKQDIGIYDWNANPWVWVIEFEQCEKPEGI